MKTIQKILSLLFFILILKNADCQVTNQLIPFASGLTSPVGIVNAGDSRLFVVNQRGSIHIINSDGTINPQPFLDIHDRIVYAGERGLLGVAFHPQYKTNGFFYVNYIGTGDSTHISRFKVDVSNADVADSSSELKLMTISQPFTNHKGGELCFGPDGYLYIGLGDGGSSGDPGKRAQNPMDYHGKMLRIDVDHGNPYSVPASNPFYGSTTTLNEIWALGLRNPWRYSFDRLTGDLWIADVGQSAFEEIDVQPANSKGGENYGWNCYEGNQPYNNTGCVSVDQMTFPAYVYNHNPECSITGGYVFRGSTTSSFYGHYFFADYCSDRIWTLHKSGDQWIRQDFGQFSGNGFSTFGEDASGQIYIAGVKSGKIYRINDQSTGTKLKETPADIKIISSPYSDIIRVETTGNNKSGMQIEIFDITGKKLYQKSIQECSYEFNSDFLPASIYFLKVTFEGNSQTQKLVIGK
jgi:glucose/arabinose dehydrogenase